MKRNYFAKIIKFFLNHKLIIFLMLVAPQIIIERYSYYKFKNDCIISMQYEIKAVEEFKIIKESYLELIRNKFPETKFVNDQIIINKNNIDSCKKISDEINITTKKFNINISEFYKKNNKTNNFLPNQTAKELIVELSELNNTSFLHIRKIQNIDPKKINHSKLILIAFFLSILFITLLFVIKNTKQMRFF